jgi:hypothetical protein
MHLTSLHYLFLIPVGLAVAFLLWVLWGLTKQLGNNRESAETKPMISIRVGNRYSQGAPELRTRRELIPRSRGSNLEERRTYSNPRNSSASAPTLGMGLKRMSSSINPGVRK